MPDQERRAKVIHVSEREVLSILKDFSALPPDCIIICRGRDIPHGSVVSHVFHEPRNGRFCFVVHHPSFPVWHDGADCPGYYTDYQTCIDVDTSIVRIDKGNSVDLVNHLMEENARLRAMIGVADVPSVVGVKDA